MRRLLTLFLISLIFAPILVSAETFSVILHPGQSISVNGIVVRFMDFSEDGRVAVEANGTVYVLSYGDTVEIGKGVNLTVGSLNPQEGSVRLILYGKNISLDKGPSNIQLESMFPSKVVQLGESVVFDVQIRNLGQEGFVPIVVNSPEGWAAKVLAGGSEVNGVYLKSGETISVAVAITPTSRPGKYPVVLQAGDSELTLWVTVVGEGVEITCPYPVKEVEAGRNVSFSLVLSSKVLVTVPLNVTLPSGWEGKFLAGGDFVRGVYLSGESTVELLVSVPSNASVGWYPIEVSAGDARTTLSVYVSKSHAGENGTVTVKVLDPESGNYIPGASVQLLRDGETVVSARTLSDGTAVIEAPEGEYTLIITKDAYNTVRRTIRVTAGSEVEVKVSLKKLPYYFTADALSPTKSGVLGDVFVYEVVLKNLGENDDTYTFDLKAPEGWGALVTDDPSSRRGMGSVYVESGSDTRLYVVLIPPDTAGIGDYHAALKITSLGSGEEKILNFTASLSGSYGIALSPGKYSLKVEAGKSAELHVRVYNTGTSPLTNVKLNVELPEDWKTKARIVPERMSELGRDEVAEFTVKFTVPANVDSGDYVVKISAVSDQDKSEEKIRVTVTKGGGSEYIGMAVILGALVLLGILLRKYGRR